MADSVRFTCAICQRSVDDFWRNGRDRQIAPVCRYCESEWSSRIGQPHHGGFMDRRKARQICALAEALHTKALHLKWRNSHGCA